MLPMYLHAGTGQNLKQDYQLLPEQNPRRFNLTGAERW